MHISDAVREQKKVVSALRTSAHYFRSHNMTNAALHLSEEVLYSPLTTSVINALLSAEKVLAALEADAGPGSVDNVLDQRETFNPTGQKTDAERDRTPSAYEMPLSQKTSEEPLPAYKPTDLRNMI